MSNHLAAGMRTGAAVALLMAPLLAQPPGPQPYRTGLKFSDYYLHDPWILAHKPSQTYYLYTSGRTPGPDGKPRSGVVTYKSKDMLTWAGPAPVFAVPDGLWANPNQGTWAPEVHEYRGKFYLFVTLHNNERLIDQPEDRAIYQGKLANRHYRATQIFASDSPEGPFRAISSEPATPRDFMTLDGTLWVEDNVPYEVYAHEWIQMLDGTMEAIPLKPDLTGAAGEPFHLFKASDAPWYKDETKVTRKNTTYVTDGPQFYRTRTGRLLMIWSNYRDGQYVETIAHSESGKLRGPWKQGDVLVGDDSGHGMLFHAFDGRLMLIVHQPFRAARGKLFEIEDTGDTLRIKRQLVW